MPCFFLRASKPPFTLHLSHKVSICRALKDAVTLKYGFQALVLCFIDFTLSHSSPKVQSFLKLSFLGFASECFIVCQFLRLCPQLILALAHSQATCSTDQQKVSSWRSASAHENIHTGHEWLTLPITCMFAFWLMFCCKHWFLTLCQLCTDINDYICVCLTSDNVCVSSVTVPSLSFY